MTRNRLFRTTGVVGSLALATIGLGVPASAQAPQATGAPAGSAEFTTVGESSWTVPAGVCVVEVSLSGASGGSSTGGLAQVVPSGGQGGTGAVVTGSLAVTSGATLSIMVGGVGGDAGGLIPTGTAVAPAAISPTAGGVGGGGSGGVGGAGGGGGGGASWIAATSGPLVVAGGGGGGGSTGPQGPGGSGGDASGAGADGGPVLLIEGVGPATVPGPAQATGGGAGTSTAGGAGGISVEPTLSVDDAGSGGLDDPPVDPSQLATVDGGVGDLLQGGAGGQSGDGGGGGGGGLYGGGGGGAGYFYGGGGGGGGSSLVPAAGSVTPGNVGDGEVSISWPAGGGCATPAVPEADVVATPRYTG